MHFVFLKKKSRKMEFSMDVYITINCLQYIGIFFFLHLRKFNANVHATFGVLLYLHGFYFDDFVFRDLHYKKSNDSLL